MNMSFSRIITVSAMALVAAAMASGSASADHRHRMRILWPKIFAPEITGYLYRDELDEEDDFLDYESGDEYRARNRRGRDVVLDFYDDGEYEPEYLPPKKPKPKKVKPKLAVAKKPLLKSTTTTAAIGKPKLKSNTIVASTGVAPATVASAVGSSSATTVRPQTVAPKTAALVPLASKTPTASKTQLANTAPASGKSIGCSKGAEIVSGYGFTSVKPRSCTGSNYSFSATRGATGYLINLAAATGEITDVQKLK